MDLIKTAQQFGSDYLAVIPAGFQALHIEVSNTLVARF